VRDSFAEHLGQTESLSPAEWSSEELPTELTKGLARVDQAKAIYSQSRARLAALRQHDEAEGEMPPEFVPEMMAAPEKSFGAMVREGFAYTLPLLLVALSVLLVFLLLHH